MRNLDRAWQKICKLSKVIGNRKITARTLTLMLNKEFKSMKVRFSIKNDKLLKGTEGVRMEGFYNGSVPDRSDPALYVLQVNKDPKMKYLKPRIHGFFREVYLILAHEFRHAYQYRRRKHRVGIREKAKFKHFNKSIREDVRYLIDYDEIDAYAFEAVEEMKLRLLGPADLRLTSIYRTMYGKNVKKYAHKHYKRWVRKVFNLINKKTIKRAS